MENLKDLFNIVNLNSLLGEYTTPLLKGIEDLTLDFSNCSHSFSSD